MIDGQNCFDQPVKNNLRNFDSIRKTATDPGDDYTTGCLLVYNYFRNCYKVIATDLSKQQTIDVDPKAVQQINFTGNIAQEATIFFSLLKKQKKLF